MEISRRRRQVIVVLTALVVVAACLFSADRTMRARSPAAAAAAFPFDKKAPVLDLNRRVLGGAAMQDVADATATARSALVAGALDPVALRVLGQATSVQGHDKRGLELVELSERVSRRDLATQIFLLEEAVGRGSVSDALVHYDRALRTKPTSSQLLFPVLAGALDDPGIRAGLIPYVLVHTPWMATFLNFAALDATRTAATADLLITARADRNPWLLNEIGSTLITRLVQRKEMARAIRIMVLMGGSPAIVSNAGWAPASIDPRFGALAWAPADTPAVSGRFASGAMPQFGLYAAQGQSGTVLSKRLSLAAGRYVLSQQASVASREGDSALAWRMTCVGQANHVWTSPNVLTDRPVRLAGVTVPAGCPFQDLELIATGGSGQVGMDATITRFRLDRG